MVKYCSNCGEELDDVADFCTTCGDKVSDDSDAGGRLISYLGSIILLALAFTVVSPSEGYDIWYLTGAVWATTGILTLPPVKSRINENSEAIEIDRSASWAISILGFVIGFFAIPV